MTDKAQESILKETHDLIQRWQGKDGNLIMILHEIQNRHGYMPRGISLELSKELGVPLARIYEVITFYNLFKLTPPAKHNISVCMGTACYLNGAPEILSQVTNLLHIKEGEVTKDGLFSLNVVRCLGCCGLSPVITVDDKIYAKVKRTDIIDILGRYAKEEENAKA